MESANGVRVRRRFRLLVAKGPRADDYLGRGRVFWIVDNCSAYRGARAVQRLQSAYPQLVLVHAPVHASWLNQVEIYKNENKRTVHRHFK
jgi:hypothetical protein